MLCKIYADAEYVFVVNEIQKIYEENHDLRTNTGLSQEYLERRKGQQRHITYFKMEFIEII